MNELKQKIINNTFINELRFNMIFDDIAYNELVTSLNLLSKEMENKKLIDKELALYLYMTPQMIYNTYHSFDKFAPPKKIVFKLEEAWIELDSLVIKCLS